MQGNIDPAGYRNDKQEIRQHRIAWPSVARERMRHPQKDNITNDHSIINYTMKLITFFTFILGKYADANENIGNRDKNS